jgi:hypothetical protein
MAKRNVRRTSVRGELARATQALRYFRQAELPARIRSPRSEPVDFASEIRRAGPLPKNYPKGPGL